MEADQEAVTGNAHLHLTPSRRDGEESQIRDKLKRLSGLTDLMPELKGRQKSLMTTPRASLIFL